ncbi:hypothetical protein BDR26DRAFT_922211 [Obelidium mucronatum]|nr:hypothetical protein BDR26DRAFT_922211 [Obelidium mucronatum]
MTRARFTDAEPTVHKYRHSTTKHSQKHATTATLKNGTMPICSSSNNNNQSEPDPMSSLISKLAAAAAATTRATNSRIKHPSGKYKNSNVEKQYQAKADTVQYYTDTASSYSDVDDGSELFYKRESHISRYAQKKKKKLSEEASGYLCQKTNKTDPNPDDPIFAHVFPQQRNREKPPSKFESENNLSNNNNNPLNPSDIPNIIDCSPHTDALQFGPVDEYPKPTIYGDTFTTRYESWTMSTRLVQPVTTGPMTEAAIKKLCKKKPPKQHDMEPEEFIDAAALTLHDLIKPLISAISMPELVEQCRQTSTSFECTESTPHQHQPQPQKTQPIAPDVNITLCGTSGSNSESKDQLLSEKPPPRSRSPSSVRSRRPSFNDILAAKRSSVDPPKPPPPPQRVIVHSSATTSQAILYPFRQENNNHQINHHHNHHQQDQQQVIIRQPPAPQRIPVNPEAVIQAKKGTIGRGASWKEGKMRVTDIGAWILLAAKTNSAQSLSGGSEAGGLDAVAASNVTVSASHQHHQQPQQSNLNVRRGSFGGEKCQSSVTVGSACRQEATNPLLRAANSSICLSKPSPASLLVESSKSPVELKCGVDTVSSPLESSKPLEQNKIQMKGSSLRESSRLNTASKPKSKSEYVKGKKKYVFDA